MRVAKPSIEEPDAEEPARPDPWGTGVSNGPGLPDLGEAGASYIYGQTKDGWRIHAVISHDPTTAVGCVK